MPSQFRENLFALEPLEPRILLSADSVAATLITAPISPVDLAIEVEAAAPIEEPSILSSVRLAYDPADQLDEIFDAGEPVPAALNSEANPTTESAPESSSTGRDETVSKTSAISTSFTPPDLPRPPDPSTPDGTDPGVHSPVPQELVETLLAANAPPASADIAPSSFINGMGQGGGGVNDPALILSLKNHLRPFGQGPKTVSQWLRGFNDPAVLDQALPLIGDSLLTFFDPQPFLDPLLAQLPNQSYGSLMDLADAFDAIDGISVTGVRDMLNHLELDFSFSGSATLDGLIMPDSLNLGFEAGAISVPLDLTFTMTVGSIWDSGSNSAVFYLDVAGFHFDAGTNLNLGSLGNTALLGFIDLNLNSGSATLDASIEVDLTDPGVGPDNDGRLTLSELFGNPITAQVSAAVQATGTPSLSMTFTSSLVPAPNTLNVSWPNITDTNNPTTNLGSLGPYEGLALATINSVDAGLTNLTQWFEGLGHPLWLGRAFPIVGSHLDSAIDLPGYLQERLVDRTAVMGIPPIASSADSLLAALQAMNGFNGVTMSLINNDEVRYNISVIDGFQTPVTLFPGTLEFDLKLDASVLMQVGLAGQIAFSLDLNTNDIVLISDSTRPQFDFSGQISQSNFSSSGRAGFISINVSGGQILFDVTGSVSFNDPDGVFDPADFANGQTTMTNAVTFDVSGTASASLPITVPLLPSANGSYSASWADAGDLTDVTVNLDDFSELISYQAIDANAFATGLDQLANFVELMSVKSLGGTNPFFPTLALVDQSLGQLIDFQAYFESNLTNHTGLNQVINTIEFPDYENTSQLRAILLSPGKVNGSNVTVAVTPEDIRYTLHIDDVITRTLPLSLGIDSQLPLDLNESIEVQIDTDLELTFGVTRAGGLFFIEETVTPQFTVTGIATSNTDFDAKTQLGFLGVDVTDGTATLPIVATLRLVDNDIDDPAFIEPNLGFDPPPSPNRITSNELQIANVATLVDISGSVSASVTLPISAVLGAFMPSGNVTATWTNAFLPDQFTLDTSQVTTMLRFINVQAADVLTGLMALPGFLAKLTGTGQLGTPIPFLASNVGSSITLGSLLQTKLSSLATFATVQQLHATLVNRIGPTSVTVDDTDNDIQFQFGIQQNLPAPLVKYSVDEQLTDLGLNIQATGSVAVTGTAQASLDVGISLDDGISSADRFYIRTGPFSEASVEYKVNVTSLTGTGSLGWFPVSVSNGTAKVGSGPGLANPASTSLSFNSADGRVNVTEMQVNPVASMGSPSFLGEADLILPIRSNTITIPEGENPRVLLTWTNLSTLASVSASHQQLDPFLAAAPTFNSAAATAGKNAVIAMFNRLSTLPELNVRIPFISEKMSALIDFVAESKRFFQAINTSGTISTQLHASVQDAIDNAGLDPAEAILTLGSAHDHLNPEPVFNYIFTYQKTFTLTHGLVFGDGTTFTLDPVLSELMVDVVFSLRIEFGLGKGTGFYIQDAGGLGPELQLNADIDQTLAQADGTFGLLQIGVANTTVLTDYSLDFDLVDPNNSGGRITTSELNGSSSAVVNPSLAGQAHLHMPFAGRLGGDEANPGYITGFHTHWHASRPDTFTYGVADNATSTVKKDGFDQVKYVLGNFINGFIQPVLETIRRYNPLPEEVVEVLLTELPVIGKTPLELLAEEVGLPDEFLLLFEIIDFVNSIPEGAEIDLTAYIPSESAPPNAGTPDILGGAESLQANITQFLNTLESKYKVKIPILRDVTGSIVTLLLGTDVDIISWKPEQAKIGYTFPKIRIPFFNYGIPVLADITAYVIVQGSVEFFVNVEIGLTTRGLTQDLNNDGQADNDLLNGFFFGDTRPNHPNLPDDFEVGVTLTIEAGVQGAGRLLGFDIVKVTGTGGMSGTVGLDLADIRIDPEDPLALEGGRVRVGQDQVGGDNRVHLDELEFLENNYGLACTLTLGGKLEALLHIEAEVCLPILGCFTIYDSEFRWTIADFTLPCEPTPANLADVMGNTLFMFEDNSNFYQQSRISITLRRDQLGNPHSVRIIKALRDPMNDIAPASMVLFEEFTLAELAGVNAITLMGTGGHDSFRIDPSLTAIDLTRSDQTTTPNPLNIITIIVFGNAGNDVLDWGELKAENSKLLNTILHGEAGDDRFPGTFAEDFITGGDGNDELTGYAGNDEILGGLGDDIIGGGNGRDHLSGNQGADIIFGHDGDDFINGGSEGDQLFGGAGDDEIIGEEGPDIISGAGGIDLIEDREGDDVVSGGEENDFIINGSGNDQVAGDDGDDYILAGPGDSQFIGNNGNDLVVQDGDHDHSVSDRFLGGQGSSELKSIERVHLIGGGSNNTFDVSGYTQVAVVDGQGGTDTIEANRDTNFRLSDWNLSLESGGSTELKSIENASLRGYSGQIDLSHGDNTFDVSFWTGTATLNGARGIDSVVSTNDADFVLSDTSLTRSTGGTFTLQDVERARLTGGLGNNSINAASFSGQAFLSGYEGNDILTGGSGDDLLDGGKGTDTLSGNNGNDELHGGGGAGDTLNGNNGDDLIYGSDDGADIINGGSGRDRIFGRGGNDSILGGPGDDIIDGGLGDDIISGGSGSDLILGGEDHDILYGHSADGIGDDNAVDFLYGDFGTNGDEAGSGRDQLHGNGGNDFLFGEGEDDSIDGGGGDSNFVLYGSGESGTPSDFVAPTPTPPPVVIPDTGMIIAPATLADSVDYRGRWTEFGGSASGAGLSGNPALSIESSIAAGNGAIYVAWADNRTGNWEIFVAMHTVALGWTQLAGSASNGGVSSTTNRTSRRPSLSLNGAGQPVVAWTESTLSSSDIHAAAYDQAANGGQGDWVALGNSLNPGGLSGTGNADQARIVHTLAGPVVAWIDNSSGTDNAYARRFNGAAWLALGTNGASGTGISQSADDISDLTLATDGTRVAVAWTQPDGADRNIYLRESSGGSWVELDGSATGSGVNGVIGIKNINPTLAYHNGDLFVAWQSDGNASDRFEIHAAVYNGVNFSQVGNGPVTSSNGPHGSLNNQRTLPQLAAGGGELYLTWLNDRVRDMTGNTTAIYAARWDGSGFTPELPGDATYKGVAPNAVPQAPALAVDELGHPFLSYRDTLSGTPQVSVRGNTFNLGQVYYVNDNSTFGDEYTTTTGSANNDGLSPASPLRTIQAVLDAYDLDPGDVILVDAGLYENLLDAGGALMEFTYTVTSDDDGVTIIGAPNVPSVLISKLNVNAATDVTLQGLVFAEGLSLINAINPTVVDNVFTFVPDLSGSASGLEISGGFNAQVVHNVFDVKRTQLRLAGTPTNAVAEYNTFLDGTTAILLTSGGADNLTLRYNTVRDARNGINLAAASSGLIFGNDVAAQDFALQVNTPFTGPINHNDFHHATIGVAYLATAELSNNHIRNNGTGVTATLSGPVNGFGFYGNTTPNQIHQNGLGVALQGWIQNQHIYGNGLGVQGAGQLGGQDLDRPNQIFNNNTGIDVSGTIQYNHISRNGTGISAYSDQLITHNIIYRNDDYGILLSGDHDVQIVNNTLYAPLGDNIHLIGGSSDIEIRNNILWAESGYNIYVSNTSQSGFYSDYNTLHTSGTGKIGYWTRDFFDILDWQADIATFDLHSIGRTVVNPLWSEPRFLNRALDQFEVFGLVAGQRFSSPTIDAGDTLTVESHPSTGPNLLTNPSFDLGGVSSWTTNAAATVLTANPNPFDGSAYFHAGGIALGFAEQTVDLINQGFTPALLDGQDLVAVFGARLRSALEAIQDRGTVQLTFLDAADNPIGQPVVAKSSNPSDRWDLVGDRAHLPIGTRSITFRFESALSTGNTTDSYLDDAFLHIVPDTVEPNQGAYGNTAVEATENPHQHVALRSPDLYVDWERNRPRTIRWDSYNNSTESLVQIDLLQDDPIHRPRVLLNIAASTADDGAYTWTPQTNSIDFATYGLRIQITVLANPSVYDRSTEPFTVPEDGTIYWVDDASNSNDEYTPGATGNNRFTGKLATAPKPNPVNLLRVYELSGTSVLNVDTGLYPLIHNVVLSTNPLLGYGNDEGFLFTGPTDPGRVAELTAALPFNVNQVLVELNDADFVTIRHFTINKARYGIWAHNSSTNLDASFLSLSDHLLDGFRLESEAPSSIFHDIESFNNGGAGIHIDGVIAGLTDSISRDNDGDGLHLQDNGNAIIEANDVHGNLGYGVFVDNRVAETRTVFGNPDLSLGRGNLVHENVNLGFGSVRQAIRVDGMVDIVGNSVYGHGNGYTGIASFFGFDIVISRNLVYGNSEGISSRGVITENRVYNNEGRGIESFGSATIERNVVYHNDVGIYNNSRAPIIRNNVVYHNDTFGIQIVRGESSVNPIGYPSVINNTVYQTSGDAVRIEGGSFDMRIRNNILGVTSGIALSVAADSQKGFQSDYNLFYITGAGQVASWQGLIRADLVSWQNTALLDRNSLERNPDFVDLNGSDGILGYANDTQDGRDDDFHVRSSHGSFHGGAFAPVRNPVTGLPVPLVASETNDAASSPAIDRGDDTDAFDNEPFFNGNYVNIGAYGNTAQASKSPVQYVLVTRPDGGESWPQDQSFTIKWRSHDLTGFVDIDLMEVGNPVPVLSIGSGEVNDGEFSWLVPQSVTPGSDYLVRVTRTAAADASDSVFSITAPITTYYVNDGTVNGAGDWTTAPGDDANDGLTPATPKATIASVLDTYALGPGNVIRVDAGDYVVGANITLDASDSGYTIEGYHDSLYPDRWAQLDRANTSSSSFVFQFTGADDVTLDHLHITGAYRGIYASTSGDSDNIHVTNNEIHHNSVAGIYLQSSNEDWLISGNVIHGSSSASTNGIWATGALRTRIIGNELYDISLGIRAEISSGSPAPEDVILVSGNYLHHAPANFTGNGILVGRHAIAENNTVFAFNRNLGYGISTQTLSVARGNLVHGNYDGILGSGLIENNEVFNNRNYGIQGGQVSGNRVYNNTIGISTSGSSSVISNNIVYNNTTYGIQVFGQFNGSRNITLINNTVHQPLGSAIYINQAGGIKLFNNILSANSNYAIESIGTGAPTSDYNLFHITGTAQVGQIGGQDFPTRNDWFFIGGFDQHSIEADPSWVDLDGPDNILGFSTNPTGPATIIDDGDPGFELFGLNWESIPGVGYDSDYLKTTTGNETNRMARWTFENLVPGEYYQIAVTHEPDPSHGRPRYNIYVDGVEVLRSVSHNQANTTFDFLSSGVGWTVIGVLPVATSTIVVEMESASTNNDPHLADAVRIQAIEGRHGTDDDFHLQSNSRAIDAGDPNSPFLSETRPHGGRVNIGGYGNTAEATNSPDPLIQVLSPNGLEIVEEGQVTPILWRSAGLTLNQSIANINVGTDIFGNPVANWLEDDYFSHPSYSSFDTTTTTTIDLSGVTNPAPEAVYQTGLLAPSGVGNSFSYLLPVSAGDYTVRLHFVDNTTSAGSRVFDIRLQDQTVFAGYDIFADAGARYKATTQSFNVTATGQEGILLELVNVQSLAWLQGIEITAMNPNGTADPLVDLEASTNNGASWSLIASGVPMDLHGSGSYNWTAGPQTIGNTALVRVTHGIRGTPAFAQDSSDRGFTITNGGNHFYVNDGSTTGDVFTTAIGNDINDGKDPARPKATIPNLLASYDLDPGDIIHVDTGTYLLVSNIVISEQDSGVTIEGPSHAAAIIDRGPGGSNQAAFEIDGADNVTLDHLSITGSWYGVQDGSSGSSFLTLSNSHFFGISQTAIDLGSSIQDVVVTGNRVEKTGFNTGTTGINVNGPRSQITNNQVSGWATGIISSQTGSSIKLIDAITISGNGVHANTLGIYGRGVVRVENNTASHNGTGIKVDFSDAYLLNNVAFANNIGLAGGPFLAQGNVSFSNNSIGINPDQTGTWRGNTTYNNPIGIEVSGFGSNSKISNNLVYNSSMTGVVIDELGVTFVNNTIHQPSGNALELQNGAYDANIRNNIITVQSGHAITVVEAAQRGFTSDYNLFHLTGSAKLALWGSDELTTLKDWFFEVGQGQHSRMGDPLFINPAGLDGFQGFSTLANGPAQIIDNSSPSGFSTTGSWTLNTTGGYNGSFLSRSNSNASATWTFTNLTPGSYHTVAATWAFNGSGMQYRVSDGIAVAAIVQTNQGSAPNDFSADGATWENLAIIRVTGTTLTVTFDSYGTLSADAVRIQEVKGDLGLDDNFHLPSFSPAIDQADPNTYFLGEPYPNGGRANLGAYGNTSNAALSPAQTVQVLSPNGWEKYELGQLLNLEWLSSGFLASQRIGLINVGGLTVDNWLADQYSTEYAAPNSSTFPGLNTSSLANPAPDEVYRHYLYLNQSNPRTYDIPLPDGTYNIRIHFTTNSNVAGRQIIDVLLQNQTAINDLDLWNLAPTTETATAITVNATVAGGSGLTLELRHDRPNFSTLLAGIEIIRPNPGGFVVSSANLDLSLDNGTTWTTLAANVGMDRFGRGSLPWNATGQTTGNQALLRVTGVQYNISDTSNNPFTLTNNGNAYYINDALTGTDIFTTNPGDNFNDGKSPETPMANLAALVAAYDLDPGDLVSVDGGSYRLLRDVLLLEEDSGARIQGLPIAAPSILHRVNRLQFNEVFDLRGAENVILRDLQITGGNIGVLALDPDTARSGLTLQNNEFVDNESRAIEIKNSYNNALITANLIHDTSFTNSRGILAEGGLSDSTITITNNVVFGHTYGMYIDVRNGLIDGNEVYGNSNTGIYASGPGFPLPTLIVSNNIVRNNGTTSNGVGINANALVRDNLVYGHGLSNGQGILLASSGVATNNTVHDNYYGIYSTGGVISDNRVYNNSEAGIYSNQRSTITGNYVYSNSVGIWLQNRNAQVTTVTNNLVYNNTNQGILINTSFGSTSIPGIISQNTIYQPVGDAVRIENNTRAVTLRNNIMWVLAGFNIYATSNSQTFKDSDYNILFQSNDPNAHVGYWNNTIQDTLTDWQTASALDPNSIDLNPLFVDIDGADNILGYDSSGDGFDGGKDDNFYRHRNSPATDSGDPWGGTSLDIEGFGRIDDPGVPNTSSPDYFANPGPDPVYDVTGMPLVTGTPQNWFSENSSFFLSLPFSFPYFDSTYTSVRVYVAGYILFSTSGLNNSPGTELETSQARLMAPLWDDLNTLGTGDNIFVDSATPGALTLRWDATNSADDSDVHFALTLVDDGTFSYHYGAGNTNLDPQVGVSHGNGFYGKTIPTHDGQSTLTIAPTLEFDLAPGITDIGAYEFRGSSLDTTPPGVLQTFFTVTSGPNGQLSQMQVEFTEVLNTIDANAPANYELRDDGGNGIFGDAGDVIFDLIPHYTAGTTTVLLDIVVPGGGLLPPGKYQLTVSGNTTIHDLSGLRLDGDNDGNEGGNFVLSNQSPVLDPIGNKVVAEGDLLSFTATASDPDVPAHNLSFSLGSNAPAAAAIDPVSGLFTWQTTPDDGQALYQITIIVTDDGIPSLTASETISVLVNEPPALLGVSINDGLAQRSRVDRLALTFNDNLTASLDTADIVLENLDTATVINPGDITLVFDSLTLTATLTFPGLVDGLLPEDGNYRVTVLAAGVIDPQGLSMASNATHDFHVLVGDANGDRTTNDLDLYRVWQNLLKPVMDRNPNEDLNGDGLVDSGDLNEVTSNYLATLPGVGGSGGRTNDAALPPVSDQVGTVAPVTTTPPATLRRSGWNFAWLKDEFTAFNNRSQPAANEISSARWTRHPRNAISGVVSLDAQRHSRWHPLGLNPTDIDLTLGENEQK